jgi:hypothetical protein
VVAVQDQKLQKSIFIVERGGIAQGSEKTRDTKWTAQKKVSRLKETEKSGIRHQWWLTRPSDPIADLTLFPETLFFCSSLPSFLPPSLLPLLTQH